MIVSYKKLWEELIDRDLKKRDLAIIACISDYIISKTGKRVNATAEILGKCVSLMTVRWMILWNLYNDADNIIESEVYINVC